MGHLQLGDIIFLSPHLRQIQMISTGTNAMETTSRSSGKLRTPNLDGSGAAFGNRRVIAIGTPGTKYGQLNYHEAMYLYEGIGGSCGRRL